MLEASGAATASDLEAQIVGGRWLFRRSWVADYAEGGEDVPYDLQTAVEEWISRLPNEDFRALCARVRPPDELIQSATNEASR